jgi:hypothetical protein
MNLDPSTIEPLGARLAWKSGLSDTLTTVSDVYVVRDFICVWMMLAFKNGELQVHIFKFINDSDSDWRLMCARAGIIA